MSATKVINFYIFNISDDLIGCKCVIDHVINQLI